MEERTVTIKEETYNKLISTQKSNECKVISTIGSNKPSESITIPKESYDELIEDQSFLEALRAAGVDNWSGYSFAQELIEEVQNE